MSRKLLPASTHFFCALQEILIYGFNSAAFCLDECRNEFMHFNYDNLYSILYGRILDIRFCFS